MKNCGILFSLFLFLAIVTASAQEVEQNEIFSLSDGFIKNYFGDRSRSVDTIITFERNTRELIYIVQLQPGGWILVSGNKGASPVIGFNYYGTYEMPEENVNNPAYHWIKSSAGQIENLFENPAKSEHPGWSDLADGASSKSLSEDLVTVDPLIWAEWGQGEGWNSFCPEDIEGPGGHAYVGCVGVAMAQSMTAFEKPDSGYSSHTYYHDVYGSITGSYSDSKYHWAEMLADSPDSYNAMLLYDCATAVDMNFGPSSSSATTSKAAHSLGLYFYFSKNIRYKLRSDFEDEWNEMMINELLKGNPIIYRGRSEDGSSGHAFNVDGVVNSNYFHLNWGWSGNSNGFFLLDALNPSDTRSYNKSQAAIVGLQPYYYPTGLELTDSVVYINTPSSTAVGKIEVIDEGHLYNDYTISLICDSSYINSVWVKDYFIDGDSLRIGKVFTTTGESPDTIHFHIADKHGNSIETEMIIRIEDVALGTEDFTFYNETFMIFPNPAREFIEIQSLIGIDPNFIRIYSSNGAIIKQFELQFRSNTIDISSLGAGTYIIEAVFPNGLSLHRKLIKN